MRFSPTTQQELQFGNDMKSLFSGWGLALQERRYAKQASIELLALYRALLLEFHTYLETDIYRALVMRRSGCSASEANITLQRAFESYALWPSQRSLTLCDVIHYIAVSEFLATHTSEVGIRSNMGQVVTSRIPHELCAARSALLVSN